MLNRTDAFSPLKKAESAGTMTRIVIKASKAVSISMEQSKASKILFFIFFPLFTVHAVTVRFIIVLLNLNVRISLEKHIVGVCVNFH